MKIRTTLIVGLATLGLAAAANAQTGPNVYWWTGTLSEVDIVGGIGPQGDSFVAASWKEAITITNSQGEETQATLSCKGMNQPDGSLYDRHVSCNATSSENSGSSIMGCMKEGEDNSAMSCTGYFYGKVGELEGHVSLETAYYRFSEDGSTVAGSGHWIR